MRVTGKMLRERILRNIQSVMENLQTTQTQIATGKRVHKPSDDPVAVSRIIMIKAFLADSEQFVKNIDDALGWLDSTEPAVDAITSAIMDLKDIAIEGASDTKTEFERSVLAEQLDRLIESLVSLANSRYDHRYVFAGTHTLTIPYSAHHTISSEPIALPTLEWVDLNNARIDAGSVTVSDDVGTVYVEGVDYEIDYALGRLRRLAGGAMGPGPAYTISYDTETICRVELNVPDTEGDINREVAQGVYMKLNTGGEEIFSSQLDIFDLVIDVKTALFRNDGVSVNQSLDQIEDALKQVTGVLGDIGVRRNAFEMSRAKLESELVNLQALISKLRDADMAEVIMRLQMEQMAYESALAAASNIMNTSLVNFIK